jgi:uncharacterized protein (AIM24 family)
VDQDGINKVSGMLAGGLFNVNLSGSDESIQMKFAGQGFVVIQPCEETYFQKT